MNPSINDKQPEQQQLVSSLPLPATTELTSTRTPQHPTLDPTPRKALKVLEKAKFINYTHPKIGWKRTLKGMFQPSLLIKMDLKRAKNKVNNHPLVLFS